MHISVVHGLLGAYCFYDHLVCCRLLPLRRILLLSQSFGAKQVRRGCPVRKGILGGGGKGGPRRRERETPDVAACAICAIQA